jgi:general secretion pathway protein J
VRPRQQGFTLLELLLAMTILGLIMAALSGGLQFGARVWESGAARAEALTERGVAQNLLRRLLAQAYPMPAAGAESQQVLFSGTRERIVFVALAPAQAAAGFYRFDLQRAGGSLTLGWQPLGQPDDEGTQQTVLLEDVDTVECAFWGAGGDGRPPGWQTQWTAAATLPALVRIAITFADRRRRSETLVIRPMIDRGAAGLSDLR